MDLIDSISQAGKTSNWNLIRHSNFHPRFFKFNYCGITALHQACYDNAPVDIVRTILKMNPKAAYIQERQYNCVPLHWAVKNNNIDNVNALLKAAPSCVRIEDKDGNTPFYYSFHGGDPTVIQILRKATSTSYSIMKKYRRLFLELVCSRFQRSLKHFMDFLPNDASPGEILEMSAIYCNNQYKIRDLYEIILILLSNHYIIEDCFSCPGVTKQIPTHRVEEEGLGATTHSPWMKDDNFWIVLQSALKDNVCQWIFCELIVRLHPQHELLINQSEMDYCHLFELVGTNAHKLPHNMCNVCGKSILCSIENRFFYAYKHDFMVCDKCARCCTMNKDDFIGMHIRDEEMERVQFIYSMICEYPQICTLICFEGA